MSGFELSALKLVPSRDRVRYLPGNLVERLPDGVAAFDAMVAAIESATCQVLLEMYWFADDRVGRRIADALIAARRRGIECAVVYDALGSHETADEFFDELRAEGLHVIEYHPIRPWRRRFKLATLTRRDHRKVLIVDACLAITGGVNISAHWLPVSAGGEGWHDECVRVRGPAVCGFVVAFARVWKSQGGPLLVGACPAAPRAGSQAARVLAQAHFLSRGEIYRSYLGHLRRAKSRIWLANAYFLPDRRILRALCNAANRGVDVRILIPGRSDVALVRHATRAMCPRLLRSGVSLYEWQGPMLHAKIAVVDSRWATVGTFNLDFRSIRNNLEVNLAIADREYTEQLAAAMAEDFAATAQLTMAQLDQRSLVTRVLDALAYRLRAWL